MSFFRWEKEEEFLALVNLLCLRNGGQLEGGDDEDDEVLEDEDVDSDDADTVRPHLMSGTNEDELKRRFLDRLAEVISRDKGGKQVSCAVSQEGDDSVTLHISRNEGFSQRDQQFCKKLTSALENISSQSDTDSLPSREMLWKEMLKYNTPRLQHYSDNLKRRLRDCKIKKSNLPTWQDVYPLWDHSQPFCEDKNIGDYSKQTHDSYMAFAWKQLDELTRMVNDRTLETGVLVDKAYALRHLKSLKLLLTASLSASLERKLMFDILFLGRLRSAYFTFIEMAHNIDLFRHITIVLAVVPKPRPIPHILLNFSEALKLVGLTVDKGTVRDCINAKWTVKQAEAKYDELRKRSKELPTHAELQLVFHLAGAKATRGRVFPYIGCSKLSCFLCTAFLRSYSTATGMPLKTKGCHGKVYTLWTIPGDVEVVSAEASAISTSAIAVKESLTQEVLKPVHRRAEQDAESTAAYTVDDDDMGKDSVRSQYIRQLEADQAWDREFRALQSHWFSRQKDNGVEESDSETETVGGEEEDPLTPPRQNTTPSTTGECSNCDEETSRKCSKCNKVWLCSEKCEKQYSSPHHDFSCAIGRPLDSADYLYKACLGDVMPDNQETLDDFWFSSIVSAHDRAMLMGLFKGVLLYLDVNPRELNQWRLNGTMTENIIALYEKIPETHRGGYYPWFLNNRHILESSKKLSDDPEAWIDRYLAVAIPYLDLGDRENFRHLEPQAKKISFWFYATVLQDWRPSPEGQEELYFGFGFCICRTGWEGSRTFDSAYAVVYEREEIELGFLYKELTSRCTFHEFWTAYESHNLIRLFDVKGLGSNRRRFRHLEAVLGAKANDWSPSVWHLNHFVNIQSTKPARFLMVDYGFINCKTGPEILDLKNVYAELLARVDLMDLHEACIKGQLYEFASQAISLQHKFRRLMKNPYPLPNFPASGMTASNVSVVVSKDEIQSIQPLLSALAGPNGSNIRI